VSELRNNQMCYARDVVAAQGLSAVNAGFGAKGASKQPGHSSFRCKSWGRPLYSPATYWGEQSHDICRKMVGRVRRGGVRVARGGLEFGRRVEGGRCSRHGRSRGDRKRGV